jgi:hypothetical protein
MKGAYEAANKAAEFIATVGIAAITGFGALIGLVQPRSAAAPVVVGLPFLFFAASIALAVASRLVAVPVSTESDLANIKQMLIHSIALKRSLAIGALIVVLGAVVFSGFLIAATYPQPGGAAPSPKPTCNAQTHNDPWCD